MAGTGKSTITRTIARKYHDLKRLGASFFFSRGGGDLSQATKFFTDIAMQLADNIPTLKDHICKVIDEKGTSPAELSEIDGTGFFSSRFQRLQLTRVSLLWFW